MWIVAMFDLPVDTAAAKRAYADFVKFLKRDGFTRTQYSVYSRHVASKENAEVHIGRIKANLPPDGEVRIIGVTDKQFERMSVFWGKMRIRPEKPPCQLAFF
jgi:CRISPR-associated protein Cas2